MGEDVAVKNRESGRSCRRSPHLSSLHPSPRGSLPLRAEGVLDRRHPPANHVWKLVGFGLLLGSLLDGCGTVGPPIPPENIGVAAKLQRAKEKAAQDQKPPEKEQEEALSEDVEQPLAIPR